MTRRQKATEVGLRPHWKVRVVLPGALLHFASSSEPRWIHDQLEADWIDEPEYGDTIGYLDWGSVVAVTWRWSS
jgi:hypothetical protein